MNHNKINLSINDKVTFSGRLNSIKRCMNNLLNNAVLFGKEINVTLKKTMNNIVIFVDDDGPGIPEHEKENVLKPFYRMDESSSQNKSGVGLGTFNFLQILLNLMEAICYLKQAHKKD